MNKDNLLKTKLMRMMRLTVAVCCLLLAASCTSEDSGLLPEDAGKLTVRLLADELLQGGTEEGEDRMEKVVAYRFENGMLQECFGPLTPAADGTLTLTPARMTGTLRFVANTPASLQNDAPVPGKTTQDEFMRLTATASELTAAGITMTGGLELDKENASVSLKRSVARIDLCLPIEGVSVHHLRIGGLAASGYVNEQEGVPADATTTTVEQDYTDSPLTGSRFLCYVSPQEGRTSQAELVVTTSDGGWHRLNVSLPPLRRNTVCTLKVYGNGAALRLEAVEGEWENGTEAGVEPAQKGLVDRDASRLSEGVTVNAQGDTVFVPYQESTLQLVLKAELGARLSVVGEVDGVTLSSRSLTRTLQQVAEVDISSSLKMPGSRRGYIYLDTYLEDVRTGRVVLVFAPSPIGLTGSLTFDRNAVCDYGRYIDGCLGVLTLPAGKTVSVETDAGEAPWLKLADGGADETYRILAGWRPNDPEADGRIQEARLVVTDSDGGNREQYIIRRRNWGLPVVRINGTWWCKYNLRGNVKDFADQILPKDDPADSDADVLDYLLSCSDAELLEVLGDQYQAGNPEGLKLMHDGESFSYEGYRSTADNFGTLEPAAMAPDGYCIPDYDDFRFFAWDNNSNLAYYNPGAFNNNLGQRLNFRVVERNLTAAGADYGPVIFYDFEYEGSHWTLCGLGHQWDEGKIAKTAILLATYGNAGSSWMMEGYPQSNGSGNWMKYSAQNAVKTRTVRCVKTPVEYVYE